MDNNICLTELSWGYINEITPLGGSSGSWTLDIKKGASHLKG